MSNKTIVSMLLGAGVACLPAYSKPAPVPSDAAFLAMAAQADMTIAHIGQMAEDRGTNTPVKDFGKTLVQDHTSDYQELTNLAAQTGETVPKAIDRENDRTIAALERYRGKSFDRALLARQSAEHEKLIRVFKEEAEHGSNAAIKEYATKALPTIERHLHDAQDLEKHGSS